MASSIIILFAILTSAFAVDITNNTAPDHIGTYKLIFVWPWREARDMQNCAPVKYSNFEFTGNVTSASCECEKRNNATLALVKERTRYERNRIVFDIISSLDEEYEAVNDKCVCGPDVDERRVAYKLSDNLLLTFQRGYGVVVACLFAKAPPLNDELRATLAAIPHVPRLRSLKYEDGGLVCSMSAKQHQEKVRKQQQEQQQKQ